MKVNDGVSRSARSVRPDTRIVEVACLMCLDRFHGVPVVDAADRLGNAELIGVSLAGVRIASVPYSAPTGSFGE